MVERGRFSIEDLKRIGWRLKAARSLTGLNQEEFSLKSDIPHMTIKGWEMGRVLPRQDGIRRFLSGIESFGIQVSPEWIFFGEGNGPIYACDRDSGSKNYDKLSDIALIKAFKDDQRKKGENAITIVVADDTMKPQYYAGDVIGGVLIPVKDIIAKYTPKEISVEHWLVPDHRLDWALGEVLFCGERLYIKQANSSKIAESNAISLGKVILHYSLGRQIQMA